MTLSTPVKIVALAGLAVALGLAGVALLLKAHHGSSSPSTAAVAPPAVHQAAQVKVRAKAKPHTPQVELDASLPPIVRRALMRKPVAVVAIYDSRNGGDRSVLAAARQGAHAAHAGFVAADVAHEATAVSVATWSSSVADPGVLVVRRPGRIVFTVTGPTDSQTVAQAAVSAR